MKDSRNKAIHAKVNEAKEAHRKSGPYKNAMEAIKSPTFNAVHKAIKKYGRKE